jgi:hypothetical protein
MDIYSVSWQAAVESAGIWPVTLVLGPQQRLYVLCYHRSDGEERVLTAGGTTCKFAGIETLNEFLLGPHDGVPADVHLALEVLSGLSPDGLSQELFPRVPVEQALYWIAGGRMLASEAQAQNLLDVLAFLNDWHDSLAEVGLPGEWPEELDDAAGMLTDVVVTHQITTLEVAERLQVKSLRPVLTTEVAQLLSWSGGPG